MMGHLRGRVRARICAGVMALATGAMTAPGVAQDQQAGQTPAPATTAPPTSTSDPRDFRLDPTRDPARPESIERQGPDVRPSPDTPTTSAPVLAPPPPVVRPTLPQSDKPTDAARPGVERSLGAAAPRPSEARSKPVAEVPATAPVADNAAESAPAVQTPPVSAPVDNAAEGGDALPAPQTSEAWPATLIFAVAGGLALSVGLFMLIRRRKGAARIQDFDPPSTAPEAPTMPAASSTEPLPPSPPPSKDRPWLDVELTAHSARLTLIGATVGYRISLRNSGPVAAENIAIRLDMANADARRQQELAQFFAGGTEEIAHHVERLEPGETREINGEYMLRQGSYTPFRAGDRLLLIPILACDARYQWGGGHNAQTAGAWVVGSEHEPPDAKLAAFRLDQGPRSFSGVGSRRMETALIS